MNTMKYENGTDDEWLHHLFCKCFYITRLIDQSFDGIDVSYWLYTIEYIMYKLINWLFYDVEFMLLFDYVDLITWFKDWLLDYVIVLIFCIANWLYVCDKFISWRINDEFYHIAISYCWLLICNLFDLWMYCLLQYDWFM